MLLTACAPGVEPIEESGVTPRTTTTTEQPLPTAGPTPPDMSLEAPAFGQGDPIPVQYTCDGENISPELHVLNAPSGTLTLALIVDDPDAPLGVWDHWVEYDIPVTTDPVQIWDEGAGLLGVQGINSWRIGGYGGPCPPAGESHRYFFTVYALDARLRIPGGVDSAAVREAMETHILAEAELMGTYSR